MERDDGGRVRVRELGGDELVGANEPRLFRDNGPEVSLVEDHVRPGDEHPDVLVRVFFARKSPLALAREHQRFVHLPTIERHMMWGIVVSSPNVRCPSRLPPPLVASTSLRQLLSLCAFVLMHVVICKLDKLRLWLHVWASSWCGCGCTFEPDREDVGSRIAGLQGV